MSGHCEKGQTDDGKKKEGTKAPQIPAGAHVGNIGIVMGTYNPTIVGPCQINYNVTNAPPPTGAQQPLGNITGNTGTITGAHNPDITGTSCPVNLIFGVPPETAGTVSQDPQSGNPTAGTASQNPQSGNPTAGALNAPQIADDLPAVKPDGNGSYAAHKMKTAQPTPDMLNPQLTYQLTSKCKGLAFILNNIDFNQCDRREGSEIDTANMKHLFEELGYTPILRENLKGEDITQCFKEFASMFNQKGVSYDSAVIALMSHGDTGVILGTDNLPVKLRDLQRELEPHKCPGLDGKPKMFFVQACRGEFVTTLPVSHDWPNTASGAQESNQLEELVPVQLDTFIADIGNPADVHFAYATTDGYLSLRTKVSGSFFVQALCEVFFDRAHLDNLDTLMNKVRARVNSRKGKLYDKELKRDVLVKETPQCVKTMLKAFYFLPNYP